MGLRALGLGWNLIAVGPTVIVTREERSVKPMRDARTGTSQ